MTIRALPLLALLVGCGGEVNSEDEAELAYIGLDGALSKSLALGFDGYNTASSANIDPQSTTGDVSGTLTVSGQVDQGSSDNKGMRLELLLEEYSDLVDLDLDGEDYDLEVTYWTDGDAALPAIELQLKDIPDGTLSGAVTGAFEMQGDLEGEVTLNLAVEGLIADDGQGGAQRVVGSTAVTGTATGPAGGVYEVDLQL